MTKRHLYAELDRIINVAESTFDLEGLAKDKIDTDQLIGSKVIVDHLSRIYYRTLHCGQPIVEDTHFVDSENRDFVELLSKSNKGRGFWEDGWKIAEIDDGYGHISIHKDGYYFWIYDLRLLQGYNGKLGQIVKVLMPNEFRNLMPGFYIVNGNSALRRESVVLRIYWNMRSEGADLLVEQITTELNKNNIPFQLKVLNDRYRFKRSDSAVLYVNIQELENTVREISGIYKQVKPFLKSYISIFSKQIYPGISFAEDPHNNRESFGQNRSRILAEAIYDILKDKVTSRRGKKQKIASYFYSNKIDIYRPYANLQTVDNYDFKLKASVNE